MGALVILSRAGVMRVTSSCHRLRDDVVASPKLVDRGTGRKTVEGAANVADGR